MDIIGCFAYFIVYLNNSHTDLALISMTVVQQYNRTSTNSVRDHILFLLTCFYLLSWDNLLVCFCNSPFPIVTSNSCEISLYGKITELNSGSCCYDNGEDNDNDEDDDDHSAARCEGRRQWRRMMIINERFDNEVLKTGRVGGGQRAKGCFVLLLWSLKHFTFSHKGHDFTKGRLKRRPFVVCVFQCKTQSCCGEIVCECVWCVQCVSVLLLARVVSPRLMACVCLVRIFLILCIFLCIY